VPVTIKDIAKRVGKSITTVSRALHDYDDVSEETKALVRQVADEIGYTPNTLAQRLQKKHADTIGLILPTFSPRFSDPFFSEFMAGIGNQAAGLGYDLLVSTRSPGDQEMQAYRLNVQSRRVDGFVIVRTRRQDPRIQYLHEIDFPFVAYGRMEGTTDFPYVDEDNHLGMRLITEHLLHLGHRRIATISAPEELTFNQYRMDGIQSILSQSDVVLERALIREGDLTQKGGYKQASWLLDLPDPPTAIIACNDLMAFGAMRAVQERGMIVGRDVSVTGFDDIPMAEHIHPPLTTVSQPIYEIGVMVCKMLISLIKGESLEVKQILLKPSLIVRQSSGAPP
jgi:LacI family transcriptional regulator